MDITELLASLLNPGGQQSILGATAVGDHNNPALLQAQMARFQQPPQMQAQPSAPAQGAPQPMQGQQAPQQPPMPQNAPQGAPAPQGGGLGGFLSNLINPQAAGKTRTVEWLTQRGLDPGTATIIASDKTALRSYLLKGGDKANEYDQRAAAAKQYGMDTTTPDGRNFILTGKLPESRGGTAELGLTPQYGVDAQDNPVLIQIGKDGKAVQTSMPDGVHLSKQPLKVDLGTSWGLIDPITRQVVGNVPKDLAGAQRADAFGKAQGAAAFDLPRVEQNAQQTLDTIQQLKVHPGRATATGASGTWDPRNYVAGTDATNFRTMLDQAKGQTFLQAYNSLKGGGSITDIEGKKATDAIARLNTAQSDEEFTKALDDFQSVIQTGLQRVKMQAGQPDAAGASQAAPSPGGGPPSFSSNKDVFDAISAGTLKIGDEIVVNGKRMRVDP